MAVTSTTSPRPTPTVTQTPRTESTATSSKSAVVLPALIVGAAIGKKVFDHWTASGAKPYAAALEAAERGEQATIPESKSKVAGDWMNVVGNAMVAWAMKKKGIEAPAETNEAPEAGQVEAEEVEEVSAEPTEATYPTVSADGADDIAQAEEAQGMAEKIDQAYRAFVQYKLAGQWDDAMFEQMGLPEELSLPTTDSQESNPVPTREFFASNLEQWKKEFNHELPEPPKTKKDARELMRKDAVVFATMFEGSEFGQVFAETFKALGGKGEPVPTPDAPETYDLETTYPERIERGIESLMNLSPIPSKALGLLVDEKKKLVANQMWNV
jgi:hypothetical protein